MEGFIGWITANWADVLAIITGIITVASIIVKLTPTVKDDAALAWVMKIFETLALNKKK